MFGRYKLLSPTVTVIERDGVRDLITVPRGSVIEVGIAIDGRRGIIDVTGR